ncbi:hypothetical protein L3Q82_012443 [Scortum barcoo]|uniref:Uncharacterized protein n=1 Tax=Scortum barcoo TaxID=214431 RepID=A0ACB8W2V7_9TELE|nr:hypothetical protein L3Q82_012443 [Scortum barcoo]
MCRLSSGIHENLHFGSTRSKSLQLDTAMSHDHMKAGLGSVHSSPEGLAPKLFSGRGESAVEKLQLISSAESSLRKTSSEYKLEGRHVSSLRPLEGTLDIGLLSGPRVSKTETCLSKMTENTSDTFPVSPPIWLQTPTERQIIIPQLKTADKLKSPLTGSPSPEAISSLNSIVASKDQSNNAATEVKICGEKTQDRHCESLKAHTSKMEASNFTVKQESRTGMKASSSLAHEHRGPRHSSHFSSCGKTPSIREVSNEDQEDEVEQQEVTPHTTSQSTDSSKTVVSLTLAKLEADVKAVESPAAAASEPLPVSLKQNINCGLDTGQRQSCEKKTAPAQSSNMTSVSKVTAQINSASVHVPESVLSKQQPSKICSLNPEPQVSFTTPASASHMPAVKTEKEAKTLEVKCHSAAPSVPAVKASPNSKQRDMSKESAPSTSNIQAAHDSKQKEALVPSTGVDVKQEESAQLTHSLTLADVRQRETQPKSSVATSTHTVKENIDSKAKSLSPKPVPSSSTLKTSVAPTPVIKQSLDAKHKDPPPKNPGTDLKNHHDSKPKHVALPLTTPQYQSPSDVPAQPNLPPVLPKPVVKKETHLPNSGRTSSCMPQETAARVSREGPKSEMLKPDGHKSPEARVSTLDKQASSGKKEQAERKKKETAQEVSSTQKSTKRDASRAAASALKDTSDKDTGRCKQQKESPRSSGNKK